MKLLCILIAFMFVTSPAQALDLITPTPQCATIKNDSDGTMIGSVRTEYGTARDGSKQRHEKNFRLPPGESTEACSTGPFYKGYQVELILKTLIPMFNCKTRLAGTIYLRAERDPKTDKRRIYAVCIPPDPLAR